MTFLDGRLSWLLFISQSLRRKLTPRQRGILLCSPVVLLAFIQISFGLAQTVIVSKDPEFVILWNTAEITSTGQAVCTVACDIAITAILCYVLNTSKTHIPSTNSVINKMIIYAIDRGAATSTAALFQLILFFAKPSTSLFTIFLLPSCQLYVISVCSMLVSRKGLRNQLHATLPATADFQLSELSATGNTDPYNASRPIQVIKEITVENFDDDSMSFKRDGEVLVARGKLEVSRLESSQV
ncbi:hypothetical protein V5O48_011224 [Marasmius crinis-equi]|uniref:DUF6534 domain-containing protein n=1 Tax=Marasmius crinis-equi TaxID=585013 RepID=A0ABR3F6L2_9AGAR